MHILAVDDELRGINMLCRAIEKAAPNEALVCFQKPLEALDYARNSPVDVAFLDVKMPELDGLGLAIQLKALHPKVNIIFVTGHSEYTNDAFALHASGYVHKPVSPKAVREQMDNLRFTTGAVPRATEWTLGPYKINTITQRVYLNGQDALLKPREFALFILLAENIEEYLAAETLYQRAWGSNLDRSDMHLLYVRLSALRKKLGMNKEGEYIIEHKRGQGYRLTKQNTDV